MFGSDFGAVEGRLRLKATSVRSSREVYVTGPDAHQRVKVRDGQLDIKTLDQVNADGLQLWRPVSKTPFPIDLSRVREVFARLGVASPDLQRAHYSADQWLAEAVHRVPDLTVCQVSKERHGSTIDGCLAEIAYLAVDGGFVKTIGVEMEDAAAVAATVRSLGFDPVQNEDYVTAFKRLARTGHCKAAPWRALK
jgi:exopolyphosphatase/guanosine-5'-triphosphate,3'-diphosphate pyrophosphatase